MLTLNTGGRPLRKTWLSRGSQAMKPQTNLVISPPPPRRDSFNPWEKIRAKFLHHVHSFGRRAVFEEMRVAMGKDHNVTGVKNDALAIH